MIEPGIVTKIEGQTAYVLFKRTSACGSCKACGMLKDMSEIIVDVPNSLGAKEGDLVSVEFSSANSLKSSLVAYLCPLFFLIGGLFLGYYIGRTFFPDFSEEVIAAVCGIVCTALAFLVIKMLEPAFRKKFSGPYRMIAIQNTKEQSNHE